ncbi:MAG: arsenate reductase (glutaredoxin) [Proteobacteria bacterium]|nr:arsenate reductase (glutaredoxin) [Pseudomonadota bacterium]NOG60137.1 arsenate reductase (glutaredoxin) [Pseudomonadota bacterium]
MKATIYHNPRCSKSRQTLAILEEKDVELDIIEYLQQAPDKKTLAKILKQLGIAPSALLRKGEAIFKELNLKEKLDDDDAILNAMVANPILIERPIVLANDKACIGRPPESVLDIL